MSDSSFVSQDLFTVNGNEVTVKGCKCREAHVYMSYDVAKKESDRDIEINIQGSPTCHDTIVSSAAIRISDRHTDIDRSSRKVDSGK